MSNSAHRLRRLLEEQLGVCCDADVQARLEELESLNDAVPATTADDRAALQTLGDRTRHRLVRLLAAADRDLCVCEITPLMDVSDSAVSHALVDLVDVGLLTRRKKATWHYYKPTVRAIQLLEALEATRGETA